MVWPRCCALLAQEEADIALARQLQVKPARANDVRAKGVQAQGCAGPRTCGPKDMRAQGCAGPRMCGPKDVRAQGHAGPRICGPLDVRAQCCGVRWCRADKNRRAVPVRCLPCDGIAMLQ